jgi:hypothetical protein
MLPATGLDRSTYPASKHPRPDRGLDGQFSPGHAGLWPFFALDHAYDHHLGPAVVVFHVQLAVRNWMVCQLDVLETELLDPPDFCQGLHMLEVQNNLMWLPTVTNVPALFGTCVITRATTPSTTGSGGGVSGGGGPATTATAGGKITRQDTGDQVRNPNRDARFVGNTPLVRLVRIRSVVQAITVVGSLPPVVV